VDSVNSRYQPQPGLAAADVPKFKWAFGFPNDTRTVAQPAIIGGRVFVGSRSRTCDLRFRIRGQRALGVFG